MQHALPAFSETQDECGDDEKRCITIVIRCHSSNEAFSYIYIRGCPLAIFIIPFCTRVMYYYFAPSCLFLLIVVGLQGQRIKPG